jgi:peptidyl-prolyl cis-trans isomerase D
MRVPVDKLPAYVGAELDGGAFGVFQVLSSKLPDTTDGEQLQAQTRALSQAFGAADDVAYIAALREKHKAQVLAAAPKSNETDSKDGTTPAASSGK